MEAPLGSGDCLCKFDLPTCSFGTSCPKRGPCLLVALGVTIRDDSYGLAQFSRKKMLMENPSSRTIRDRKYLPGIIRLRML